MLKEAFDKIIGVPNAISILKDDHRKVEQLFRDYHSEKDGRIRSGIARKICAELDIHAKIEERLFYPEAKAEATDARRQINEGIVEHEGIKNLIKELTAMNFADEFFCSRMTVLEEYVKHHVREEENEMFPKISNSDVDLEVLGNKLLGLKAALAQNKDTSTPRKHTKPTRTNAKATRPAARSRKNVAPVVAQRLN